MDKPKNTSGGRDASGDDTSRPSRLSVDALSGEHGWLFEATFLGQLDRAEQEAVLAAATLVDVEARTRLITEGLPSNAAFLLLTGEATAARDGRAVGRLIAGHLFGERSSRDGVAASATVTTESRVRALRIDAAAFKSLLSRSTVLSEYVTDLIALRNQAADLRELITRQPILGALEPGDVDRLLQWGRLTRLAPGEAVLRVGEHTDDAYLVLRGQLDLYLPSDDGGRTYASTQGPGWFFGHAAVVLSGPRTADIVAKTPVELLRIRAEVLINFMERSPMFRRRVHENLAQTNLHLRQAVESAERPHLVAVYGARRGLGSTSIAYGLAVALGGVTLVDPQGGAAAARLRLPVEDRMEGGVPVRGFRLDVPNTTLLEPDAKRAAASVLWPVDPADLVRLLKHLVDTSPPRSLTLCAAETRAEAGVEAMALADSVVYVREASDGVHEDATRRNQQRIDALRVRGDQAIADTVNVVRIPEDSAPIQRFWQTGNVEALGGAHRFGNACRRLGRKLLGESFGLALGGGGALGFAHVGLIRALEAHGIVIDLVCGSSFGALVAGLYAAGGTPALMELVARRRSLLLSAVTAFRDTGAFERFVDGVVGRRHLGSTDIPFLPVSLDIDTGEDVILNQGTVGAGVRSSSGLPGVYPAYRVGGRRLVDGGINNNVPASVAKRAGADFVLASNIIPSFPFKPGDRLGVRNAPLLNRMDAGVRSLFFLMSQNGRDRSTQADFVFNADSRGYNVYSFLSGDQIAEDGRAKAEQLMPQILEAYRKDSSRLFRPR